MTRRDRFRRGVVLAYAVATASLVGVGASRTAAAQPVAAPVPVSFARLMSLRPGDALRIRIAREPDLSGEFMVDERGLVTLPRLGRYEATTTSADSLKLRVLRDYQAMLSTTVGASVEVTPLYRVHVVGAVRTPGLFTVDPTMTVADALGLAGGVTSGGRTNRVLLVRDGQRANASLGLGARLVDLGLHSGDELYVPERSWLSRNPGVVLGAVSAAASLFWALRR